MMINSREYATSRVGFDGNQPIGTTMSYQTNSWERKLLNLNLTHQSRYK